MGPSAGGAVYSPALTDWIFMVEKTSHMFITGPEVIKAVTRETVTKEELGGAMAHNARSGVAHFASPNDRACLAKIRDLMSFLPQNNLEDPPRLEPSDDPQRRDERLREVVPADPAKPYDIREIIVSNLDDHRFFEVHEHYAKNIVVGFGRLDGISVGCGQPTRRDGRLSRHRRLAQRRALRPLLRLASTSRWSSMKTCPGSCRASTRSTAASSSHGAKLIFAFCEATVPRITLITRKATAGLHRG